MNDAVVVGVLQRLGDVGYQFGGVAGRQPPAGQHVRQRDPLDQIADEIRHAIRLAYFMDGHDGRVPELSHAAGLAQEAIHVLLSGEVAGARHFNRHRPVQLRIARPVDGAECTRTDGVEQFEAIRLLGVSWTHTPGTGFPYSL